VWQRILAIGESNQSKTDAKIGLLSKSRQACFDIFPEETFLNFPGWYFPKLYRTFLFLADVTQKNSA